MMVFFYPYLTPFQTLDLNVHIYFRMHQFTAELTLQLFAFGTF